MIRRIIIASIIVISVSMVFQSCNYYQDYNFRKIYSDANKLQHESKNLEIKPFLKAHYKNGNISILRDTWIIDTLNNIISGNGTTYDFNRNELESGKITIKIDSIAIFETNVKLLNPESARISGISMLTAMNLGFSLLCAINPKACFGSCPTFYMKDDENFHYSDAEAFSSAISPSLEYYDIDALDNELITGNCFELTMKNEALETHCVKSIKLLAYPRKKNERIYHSNLNEFYLCENNYELTQASYEEKNISYLLNQKDKNEWYSFAADNNMSAKEEIYLSFNSTYSSEDLGLILNFRQTLMTTYLIYSAMGYMGDEVGDFFAQIETNPKINSQLKNGIKKELGNIEIFVLNKKDDQWIHQGSINETGPIAINKQFVPLMNYSKNKNIDIKIVLNKGLWRLDYAALTNIKQKISTIEIEPNRIYNKNNIDNKALHSIQDSSKYLITYPGDEYKLNFILPSDSSDYELFLYSKGYYLEWMRDYWLQDKDLKKLKLMVSNPALYLKEEASMYKLYEKTMDDQFWNSRIDTKSFTQNEN